MSKIRIVIADDDPALSGALIDTVSSADDLELVAVANDTQSAIKAAHDHKPDVVLMDVKMPGGGGIVATLAVIAGNPETKVVGLSAHEDQATALQMLESGAVAYIVKGMPELEILDAIRRAQRGQLSMPADLATASFKDLLAKLRHHMQSETNLRTSEQRVHSLIDAMPDALVKI